MVQYYGEHVDRRRPTRLAAGDGRLVTTLSPHFTRAYLFGAFALIDAGRAGRRATSCCRRVSRRIRTTGASPPTSASSSTRYGEKRGEEPDRGRVVSRRPRRSPAARTTCHGSPLRLLAKGGERRRRSLMWGQAYLAGDKYARAEGGRGPRVQSCPEEKEARMQGRSRRCTGTMPEADVRGAPDRRTLVSRSAATPSMPRRSAGRDDVPARRHRRRLRPAHRQLPQRLGLAAGAPREHHAAAALTARPAATRSAPTTTSPC